MLVGFSGPERQTAARPPLIIAESIECDDPGGDATEPELPAPHDSTELGGDEETDVVDSEPRCNGEEEVEEEVTTLVSQGGTPNGNGRIFWSRIRY